MNKILLDIPTKIITPRLILRPPQAGDGPGMYKVYKDGYEDMIKWLNHPPKMASEEEFEIDCRKHQAEWILRGDMRLLIIDKQTNTIMGRNSYPPHLSNWNVPYFGISYMLGKTYQGQGFVTESVSAMIRFAFVYLKARKVEIKCDVENTKSVGVPERLGMKLEATQVGTWPSKDKQNLATIRTYAIFDANELPSLAVEYS
jgi:RimJ/RimL family protein N-acetyltransferase